MLRARDFKREFFLLLRGGRGRGARDSAVRGDEREVGEARAGRGMGEVSLGLEATAGPPSWCMGDANDRNNRAPVPRPFVVEPGLWGGRAPSP